MADISYDLIKKALNVCTLRQTIISNNISNVNTKGFKRSDVSFEEALKDEVSKYGLNEGTLENVEPTIIKDNSTSMRMDGNNVDIDIEMANQAENNIMYNALISQYNTKLGIMRYVINEGRK